MKIKPNMILKYIFICLIILFITIYISYQNGYFAYSNYQKSILTKEKIKQFEEDVANGKVIDINNYLEEDKDYSNKLSRVSLSLSNTIGKYIKKTLTNVFKKVNKLIE